MEPVLSDLLMASNCEAETLFETSLEEIKSKPQDQRGEIASRLVAMERARLRRPGRQTGQELPNEVVKACKQVLGELGSFITEGLPSESVSSSGGSDRDEAPRLRGQNTNNPGLPACPSDLPVNSVVEVVLSPWAIADDQEKEQQYGIRASPKKSLHSMTMDLQHWRIDSWSSTPANSVRELGSTLTVSGFLNTIFVFTRLFVAALKGNIRIPPDPHSLNIDMSDQSKPGPSDQLKDVFIFIHSVENRPSLKRIASDSSWEVDSMHGRCAPCSAAWWKHYQGTRSCVVAQPQLQSVSSRPGVSMHNPGYLDGPAQARRRRIDATEEEFDYPARAPGAANPKKRIKRLENQLAHARKKARVAKQALQCAVRAKSCGRITNLWRIKVALVGPQTSLQTLSHWCRDFPPTEAQEFGYPQNQWALVRAPPSAAQSLEPTRIVVD
ncbi:unnamed protein product [Prorocentrum cordatum]|uniref:BZIP domain-containing protein n=1 Tax=Prorocentrum cordatum TaxID=2364126 RepID=A0ABN9T932_9DINO|nr:unnamed protein product [Polarella glacialis]